MNRSPANHRGSKPRFRLACGVLGVGFLAVLLLVPPAARAAPDDFEFGQKLAANRYFGYARKVYEGILADANASDLQKDEARYGLALLKKDEALAAAGRGVLPYPDVVKLFDDAAQDVQDFVRKNPNNKNATQARLDVGTIRLAFVQWARELLQDEGEMQDRGIQASQLQDDAKRMVTQALEYFDGLRPDPNADNPTPVQALASYYYVTSEYYRALVEPACSPSAMAALEKAGTDLDEYIMMHDGQLLAVYAQDICGLVFWEKAKCEEDVEKKEDDFNKAFEWFETCIYTPDEGPDYLRIITNGYYHIAQAGLDAGRMPKRNFARDALEHMQKMLKLHPTAWRVENGLRAMVEWSKLECQRGNASRAVDVANDAAQRAKTAGIPAVERLANRQLRLYVSGSCGGGVGGLAPEVLKRVADDLYNSGQWYEAVKAYRTVIGATGNTSQDFVAYRWDAWEKIASCYGKMDDAMARWLAYEPINDAWKRGDIPHQAGNKTDENMQRAARDHRLAMQTLKDLAQDTGSALLDARYKAMLSRHPVDYPDDDMSKDMIFVTAKDKFVQALSKQKSHDASAQTLFEEARKLFQQFGKMHLERSPEAWPYYVRTWYEQGDYAGTVKAAEEVEAWWSSPEEKAAEEKSQILHQGREAARPEVTYWKASALHEMKKPGETLAALADFQEKWPDARDIFKDLAQDLVVQAHVELSQIEKADAAYRALLKRNPKYFRLSQLTFLLAEYYNKQRSALQGKLNDLNAEIFQKRKEFRLDDQEAFRISAQISDLMKQLQQDQRVIKAAEDHERDPKHFPTEIPEKQLEAAKKDAEELQKNRIPELKAKYEEFGPKRDQLQVEIPKLQGQATDLKQQMYDPLVKAADYYLTWDETNEANGTERDPRNVAIFAQLFWQAGRLRPDVSDNWQKARKLYESYLSFPQIKAKPNTDPEKRDAIANLGDVYVNLAEKEKDPAERQKLVLLAVDHLQNSLAANPADNDLVVGMLSDKILVLSWKDRRSRQQPKTWRFAIPRPSSVKELRDAVRDLAKEPPPRFATEQEKTDYKGALHLFQSDLNGENDSVVRQYVVPAGKSTFDPILYREIANWSPSFRLTLAWAYSHTGRDEDVPKALNLALSLIQGPLAVDEDSPEWWRARDIQMRLYLDAAARRLQGGGTATSEAAQSLQTAGDVLRALAATYSDLGESAVPGNKEHWMKTLLQLNDLRAKAGMPAIDLPKMPK